MAELPEDASPLSQEAITATEDPSEENRDSWLYFIDSTCDPDGDVPPYAVIGGWPVDENGQLGPFSGNPDYRPTPAVLDMDVPTDAVDAALQLAVTGHVPESDVVAALAEAEVYVPADAEGDLIAYGEDDDQQYVAIFTDPSQTPSTAAQLQPVDMHTLLSVLPADTLVAINPGGQAAASFVCSELLDALSALDEKDEPHTADQSQTPTTAL